MKEITVRQLKDMIDRNEDHQLIDVREPEEFNRVQMGGELIPMREINNQLHKISSNKKVIIHCRSGRRSANVIIDLERQHQFDNLYNLKGGIIAWAEEIDPTLTVK